MPMRNKLKAVLEERLGQELTAYRLKKLTGLGQKTTLNAINNPDWYPDKSTAEVLCQVFNLQLSDFMFFEREDGGENAAN